MVNSILGWNSPKGNYRDRKVQTTSQGNLNVSNGKYLTNCEKVVRVKYSGKVRLCLGVAAVKMMDGRIIGKCCQAIDYTGKVIISPEEEEKRIRNEIQRVKGLKGNRTPWIQKIYPPDYDPTDIWEEDYISIMQNIGKSIEKRLKKENK